MLEVRPDCPSDAEDFFELGFSSISIFSSSLFSLSFEAVGTLLVAKYVWNIRLVGLDRSGTRVLFPRDKRSLFVVKVTKDEVSTTTVEFEGTGFKTEAPSDVVVTNFLFRGMSTLWAFLSSSHLERGEETRQSLVLAPMVTLALLQISLALARLYTDEPQVTEES